MNAITVDGVTKRYRIYSEHNQRLKNALLLRRRSVYREFEALTDVSFVVPRGTTFGLIGSNGAGKSTMLKVLARILEPDVGTVTVEGRTSALLELGAGFHPELSGRENVFLNGAILGIPKAVLKARFDQVVEFAGLQAFIDNPVKTYSSGMYARLGFSVAVNVDPEILLIDEVLAVGDENFQRRCAEKIEELRSEGRTVVIVSHGLEQVRALCNEIAWIDHGKLQSIGKSVDVIQQYLNHTRSDTVVETDGSTHTGDGRVHLDVVRLLGAAPQTGNPMTIEISWTANEHVERPVVGFAVRRNDGVRIAGTNTRDQIEIPSFEVGKGSIRFEIPRLALLPGSYEIDATIADHSIAHIHDHLEHGTRFDVGLPDSFPMHQGVVDLDGTFSAPVFAGPMTASAGT